MINSQEFACQSLALEIISCLAHDLSNPLMIISGNAQLVQMESGLSQTTINSLQIIQEECQKSRELLQRPISLLRHTVDSWEPYDISSGTAQLVDSYKTPLAQAGITITQELPAEPVPVKITAEILKALFDPIMQNARESMPQGGSIRITLSLDSAHYAHLCIADEGEGLPIEKLKIITRPFFSTKPGKIGLGLTLTQGMTRNLGGILFIEKNHPQGAKISVTLPVSLNS